MAADPTIYTNELYFDTIVFLSGAVIAAPIFKRIGLGTVLGYLVAGLVIGPIMGLIDDTDEILHFSELGVVMLLFIIGLELKPARLWAMRQDIFGMGTAQVMISGILLTFLAWFMLPNLSAAIVAGFGLSLSSTAFALQMLESSGDMNTTHGRKAFSILLFQDLVIILFLAILPLLDHSKDGGIEFGTFLQGLSAIALIILLGRYLLNPMFRLIGKTGAREVMIAAALLVVFGAAMLMQAAGLSMALGSFMAGVMLAESNFRHELEADIEPFRGLLLGLFFMAIGMTINFQVVLNFWYVILICVPVAMAVKAVVIFLTLRLFGSSVPVATRVAAVLPQHGEFGFILFASAVSIGILSVQSSSILNAIITLSMALTPLTVKLGEFLLKTSRKHEEIEENFDDAGGSVLMIGFSRIGQVAAQSLLASGVEMTIIDNNVDRIRNASKFGFRIYFGDGKRREVLAAAGIEQAALVAVCTHKVEITDAIVDMVQRNWPDKPIYVRTYDRIHHLGMVQRNVEFAVRETFESAMLLGEKMLEGLDFSHEEVEKVSEDIRRLDQERLQLQLDEGVGAGMHMIHTKAAVKPEPLVEPKKDGTALDDRSKILVGIDDD